MVCLCVGVCARARVPWRAWSAAGHFRNDLISSSRGGASRREDSAGRFPIDDLPPRTLPARVSQGARVSVYLCVYVCETLSLAREREGPETHTGALSRLRLINLP